MKKTFSLFSAFLISMLLLSSCNKVGDKATSMSVIYGATAFLSLLLLVGYCSLLKKKEPWFILLFSSVFVVNTGYLCLSLSQTVEQALFANRISYLGSVVLPLSMLMIILNVTNLKYKKWLLWILIPVTVFVFFVAASPGYLDIYYKSVALIKVGGVSVLEKEYGPWHPLYLFYLIAYFAVMTGIILRGKIKKKIESTTHAVILLMAVFVNICVWLLEQLVHIEFEFLSVSYIISELFLLGLYLIIEDQARLRREYSEKQQSLSHKSKSTTNSSAEFTAHCRFVKENLHLLTKTEAAIYNLYLEGKGTRDVMKDLEITENTLKYHNKNIYSKLGVSSRKQLVEYARAIQEAE